MGGDLCDIDAKTVSCADRRADIAKSNPPVMKILEAPLTPNSVTENVEVCQRKGQTVWEENF